MKHIQENIVENSATIAFIHLKGGTGKTTSCINIAGWLVKMNKKVLVVDLDPQGNVTAGLGIDRKTIEYSISDVLLGQKDIRKIILETGAGVYVAPSSIDLLAIENFMAGQADKTYLLKNSLESVEKYFDYILIDVPPGSNLLMLNGIVSSRDIIIPLDSGVFAYETMETLKTVVGYLYKELHIETTVLMVLLRESSPFVFDGGQMRDVRNLLERFLITHNMSGVEICKIPFSRKIHRAQMKGMPISHYAPHSPVGKVYKRIAKSILMIDEGGKIKAKKS